MDENQTKKSGNSMLMVGGAVVAVVLIGGVALFARSSQTSPTPTPLVKVDSMTLSTPTSAAASPSASPSAMMDKSVKTINMEAGAFYYKPNEIKVKKGEKVKIVMTAKDMMHDFNIDALDLTIPITKSGETNSVEFVADTAGTFEFYCAVGQHRKNGQVGKLIVE